VHSIGGLLLVLFLQIFALVLALAHQVDNKTSDANSGICLQL
jgi:hypothetical protein